MDTAFCPFCDRISVIPVEEDHISLETLRLLKEKVTGFKSNLGTVTGFHRMRR